MLEKDSEFIGAIQFSNEVQMRTASLKKVREMIHAQVFRAPTDYAFLCQGREVTRVWEADRLAWSTVPFALHGSPGLRAQAMASNRKLEQPATGNPFEFRYMGNTLPRYKKRIQEISPVYTHRAFRVSDSGKTNALHSQLQWRVGTNWSGEWVYDQASLQAKTKRELRKLLRTAVRPRADTLVVKSHHGELISLVTDDEASEKRCADADDTTEPTTDGRPPALVPSKHIYALSASEQKSERKKRQQRIQWKTRMIAMEAQHRSEYLDLKENHPEPQEDDDSQKENRSRNARAVSTTSPRVEDLVPVRTVLVHIEEDNVLPSRVVSTAPKKRKRPKKRKHFKYEWYVPSRHHPLPAVNTQKLIVKLLSEHVVLKPPACQIGAARIELGQFLASSSICLESDEVEVFPVLVIRPIEELVSVCSGESVDASDADPSQEDNRMVEKEKKTFQVSPSYLSEFEYSLSASESNYEALYHHIGSSRMQDAIVLNRRDVFGRTMLHDAAEFGHGNVMELLLSARVLLNVGDYRGDTALHHAARRGHLREVSFLLRDGAIAWKRNNEGRSPLYCALETASRELLRHRVHLSSGVGEGVRGSSQRAASDADVNSNEFYATHLKYPKLRQVIDLLWDRYPASELAVEDIYDRGSCLSLEKQVYGDMFGACRNGNLLRVQRLIDLEKRPIQQYINDQMDTLGRTALHEAAELGHTAIVDLLLKIGADGYVRDQRQQIPLHIAAVKGYERIAKCLMFAFPGTLDFQDASGKTALHLAVERQHWVVAADLLASIRTQSEECGGEKDAASVANLQDIHGYTALHYSCIHAHEDTCIALIEAGANPWISRVTYQAEYEEDRGLCGVFLKSPAFFRRAGIDPSVSRIREWAKGFASYRSDLEVAFDVEAPLEILLLRCKQRLESFGACVRILDFALSLQGVRGWSDSSKNDEANRVKKNRSPLLHLAADIAPGNVSIAAELCRRLVNLRIEINSVHHKTGETVLLQECKRVCATQDDPSEENGESKDAFSQLALVRTLIELGANVNLPNELNGETPLTCAAWHGHLSLLDLLLETKQDRDFFLRSCSFSPLHFAALGGHVACAKMLMAANANVNMDMQPIAGETPLFFAIRSKREAMVSLLLESGANVSALCTIRRGTTSFGVSLELEPQKKMKPQDMEAEKLQTFGPSHNLIAIAMSSSVVVSPLTFALQVAQPLSPFGDVECGLSSTLAKKKHSEWKQMESICLVLASKLGETTATSGLITRNDVHLASAAGYWDVVQELLAHQVVLSSISTSVKMNALHYAAAAGKTSIVTALAAAGMDVNCVIDGFSHCSKHHSVSTKPPCTIMKHRNVEENGTLHAKVGALFFALANGHIETAVKLIVLGAKPLETLPHTERWRQKRMPVHEEATGTAVTDQRRAVVFLVSERLGKALRTSYLVRRFQRRHQYSDPGIHFIRYLEWSINESTPLIQLVVASGHADVVRTLIATGTSAFQILTSSTSVVKSDVQTGVGETAIHIAVAHGHMEILRFFAKLAQNNFQKCFMREGCKPKSLLVSACERRQLDALAFLLTCDREASNEDGGGGGFKYEDQREEFQQALCACATHQFVDGFRLLVSHGARPDLRVLVAILQGIIEPAVPDSFGVGGCAKRISATSHTSTTTPRHYPRRTSYTISRRNTVAHAQELLEATVPFSSNLDEFFSTTATFDHVLKVLIVCARYEFWFVLLRLFVDHATLYLEPTSSWKPVLIRAISCCFVLHRAALHNQVDLVRFILALGVPADLQLSEFPSAKSPIWYAASRGCLETFVLLAVAIEEQQSLSAVAKSLAYNQKNSGLAIHFRSIAESHSFAAPGSICKWHNLSSFSCYDIPRARTKVFLIRKLTGYARDEMKQPELGHTLLHIASAYGDLLTVQTVVNGGANVGAENARKESPLLLAAGRKDAHGTSIVQYLLSVLRDKIQPNAAEMINHALIRCYAQSGPYNLAIAKALLAAGADVDFSAAPTTGDGEGASVSAMMYALDTVQYTAVKLLLDHGASLTISFAEVFVKRFLMSPVFERKLHWRRFAAYLAFKHQRLLDVESIMVTFLEQKHFLRAMNEDLLHQLVKAAAALAATIARCLGMEKRFWRIIAIALNSYPGELRARKAEWGDRTALHYAVFGLEVDIVSGLLDVGNYDVLAQDQEMQTPLHLAAVNGEARICGMLLRKLESDRQLLGIDTVDNRGRTALHLAVIHGNDAIVELLVSAGASVELRCASGLNSLLYACKCNRLAILMSLYAHKSAATPQLLFTTAGEHAIIVAARQGVFQIVRWLAGVYQDDLSSDTVEKCDVNALRCHGRRTLLHYASIAGDDDFVRQSLESQERVDSADAVMNERDLAGYTPLMYAFGFGRVRAFQLLIEAGSTADVFVDHSNEAKTHPYATGFNIATLLQWFAFPGWYSFASKQFPRQEHCRLTSHDSIDEDYLMNSSVRGWRVRAQRPAATTSHHMASATKRKTRVRVASRFEKVRTSMRQWRFPQMSLFDYACDVGDAALVSFLTSMQPPVLLRRSTYQSQRRNMLQAVRWNRLDVVKSLITACTSGAVPPAAEATKHTDGLHFMDYLEVGIDCAGSRGHEEIAIYLLEQWSCARDSGRNVADAGAFAFQFAHVLQIACIRRMTKLIEYTINRGGEQLVAFHANEGPALVYAVAFGHTDVAALLLSAGAHFSSLDTYVAPSVKKWAEFGCLKDIQVQVVEDAQGGTEQPELVEFVGPLEGYDAPTLARLSQETICEAFASSTVLGSLTS